MSGLAPLVAVLLLALATCSNAAAAGVTLPGLNATDALTSSRKLQGFRPIPIDASVVLLSVGDVEGGSNSECRKMVDRAKEFRGRAINFFITHYYADYNGDNVMDQLGYRESRWDKTFRPMTYAAAYRFAKGLSVSRGTSPGGVQTTVPLQ